MVLTYNTHIHTVREELHKIWLDVIKEPFLNHLYPEPPRIALKRNRSLRDMLVKAKLKKQTPLEFTDRTKCFDTYNHCRMPSDYPKNLYTKVNSN